MRKILVFLLCSFILFGCTSTRAYAFSVGNEEITILLESNDLSLKETEGGFEITKDSVSIQGMFITNETYNSYYQTVMKDDTVTILSKEDKRLIWKVQGDSGEECNCLCKITESYSVLMGSLNDVKDIYDTISFEVE